MIGTQQDHTCDVLKRPSARTTWIVVQLIATVYLAFHARSVTLTMAAFLETKSHTKHIRHWIVTYQQEDLLSNKIKTIAECWKFVKCIFATTIKKFQMLPLFCWIICTYFFVVLHFVIFFLKISQPAFYVTILKFSVFYTCV